VLWTGDDCTGDDWTDVDCTGDDCVADEADVEEAGVPVACEVEGLAGFVFGFGFLAGARSAGTATAPVSGVMAACWAPAALGAAREPAGGAAADVFLTADPMANAAARPITSAAISSAQRFRTSWPAGAADIAATLLPDMNELSIRSIPPRVSSASIVKQLSRAL
jgi:hypothetical protein